MDLENQQYISRLILFYLEGKLSEPQARELEMWRKETPEHEEMFQRMISMEYFSQHVNRFVKTEVEREAEWAIIRKRTLGARKVWRGQRWAKYAAILLLPLIGGITWYLLEQNQRVDRLETVLEPGRMQAILVLEDGTEVNLEDRKASVLIGQLKEGIVADANQLNYQDSRGREMPEKHTLKVPRGGEYSLVLADGSKVFLNAESRIEYPVTFSGDTRRVRLEGEAYFEIVKDSLHPFIVEVEGVQVKVLGTEFAVRAYRGEKEIFTTLVEGRVHVSAGEHMTDLLPDEQAVWKKSTDELTVGQVDVNLFVGWRNGRFVFDNAPLSRILEDLGRWYDFEVEYKNLNLKDLPFSLDVEKYADFRMLLELLEETVKVKFEVSGNQVIVN